MGHSSKSTREIEINVPWGYVTGKAWGDEKNPIVLCFHGIMDNAGSFDHLIPLLPDSFCYVAIDLPGQGFSSHFPPHLPIISLNYIIVYKMIVDHFKREKYIFLGHSYGAQLSFMFAQLYPNYVEKLILFDGITLIPVTPMYFKDALIDKFDEYFDIEQKLAKKGQPTYTYEEALEKVQLGRRYSSIELKTAKALLERSVKLAEDGSGRYKFTLDQRMKNVLNPARDFRYIIETLKVSPVYCPIFLILAKESPAQVMMAPLVKEMRRWKNVSIKDVDGNHDVHNEFPERVALHVAEFLLHRKGKL